MKAWGLMGIEAAKDIILNVSLVETEESSYFNQSNAIWYQVIPSWAATFSAGKYESERDWKISSHTY